MKRLIAFLILFGLVVITPFALKIKLPLWNLDFSGGMEVLWKNYDGPNYLIVAKTWYDKDLIGNSFSNPLPNEYYPAHLPLYPMVVALFDLFLSGPNAMLVASYLGSFLGVVMLYLYLREFSLSKNPLTVCLVFLVIPARFIAVRMVGSPEGWFIFFILASLYFFRKNKYFWAGLFGGLAQLTKSPAILLLGAYGIHFLIESFKQKKILWRYAKIAIIHSVFVLALFGFYALRTGDFWAYFNSGDNIHLFFPPFSIFTPNAGAWVQGYWLEDVIWILLFAGLGILKIKEKSVSADKIFGLLFFGSVLFVSHRDVTRYILPIIPLALLGYDKIINSRETKIILAVMILPAILFAWNFLLHNMAPVADWTPYL